MARTDDRTTADVVRSATTNLQTLVRREVDLAKAEVTAGLAQMGKGAAMFAGAAVLGLFIAAFVGVTGAKALEEVLVPWAAWAIVTGVYLVLAGILALVGKRALDKATLAPEQAQQSIKENVEWAKQTFKG